MGFQHALSGLNAASKSLDVIGHNIANSSTTGFKQSRAEFSEAVASALGASSGQSLGIGVTSSVSQQFSQGNISATGNGLDVAINGNGFFVLKQENGTLAYTRAGNFHSDKDGNLRTVGGDHVMGYPVDAETGAVVTSGERVPMQFPTGKPIEAKRTGNVQVELNLDARANLAAGDPNAVPPIAATPRATYGTTLTVNDQQGTPVPVNLYFEKSGDNQWAIYNKLDDNNAIPPVVHPPLGYVQMDSVGKPVGIATAIPGSEDAQGNPTRLKYQFIDPNAKDQNSRIKEATITRNWTYNYNEDNQVIGSSFTDIRGIATTADANNLELSLPINVDSKDVNPNNLEPFEVKVNLDGITQYGTEFSVTKIEQDGYASGALTDISISQDGSIVASYSNGIKRTEGQLALADFRNPQGLSAMGGDKWAWTPDCGEEIPGTAGSGTFGALNAGSLEDSNVDLTAELVNMMTAQRAYQASAQAIKTQDQVFSTLVNLR